MQAASPVMANAARVNMSGYSSGDAKWHFPHVSVSPGQSYIFSDYSKSNIASYVTIEYKKTDGKRD